MREQNIKLSLLTLALLLAPIFISSSAAQEPKKERKSLGLNLTQGQVAVKMAKLSNKPDRAFQVRTPTATCGVRGTEFDVTVGEEGKTEVHVLEGSVSILNELGEILAAAGEVSTILKGVLPDKAQFDIGKYQEILKAWQDGITIGEVRDFVKGKVKEKMDQEIKKKIKF